YSSFFFYSSAAHPYLHSFPTRRSSDLVVAIFKGTTQVAVSTYPANALSYLVPAGGDGFYYARVIADGATTGLLSQYILGVDLGRSEEHTSELQSLAYLVCRLLLEKKNK